MVNNHSHLASLIGTVVVAFVSSCNPGSLPDRAESPPLDIDLTEVVEPESQQNSVLMRVYSYRDRSTLSIQWQIQSRLIEVNVEKNGQSIARSIAIVGHARDKLVIELQSLLHEWPSSQPTYALHGDLWELIIKREDGVIVKAGKWSSPYSDTQERRLSSINKFGRMFSRYANTEDFTTPVENDP